MAFVQKITFQGVAVSSSGATLNGVTAGNFLALCDSTFAGTTNATPTDDKSNTWNTTTQASTVGSGPSCPYISYAENVASGNTAVTVDHGANYWTEGSLSEYSGMAASSLDQQTSNSGTSNSPTSGTTGTTSQADELVLACLAVDVNDTLGIDLPSGYTNLHIQQNANSTVGHSSDYLIVSAAGAQSASWGTMTSSPPWSGKIATFKAATAGGGAEPATTGLVVGSSQSWVGASWVGASDAAAAFVAELTAASFAITPQALTRLNKYTAELTARSFAFTANALTQMVSFAGTLTARAFNFTAETLGLTAVENFVAQLSAASFSFTAQSLARLSAWAAQLSDRAFAFTAQSLTRVSAFAAQLGAVTFSFSGQALSYVLNVGPRLAGWFIRNRRIRR